MAETTENPTTPISPDGPASPVTAVDGFERQIVLLEAKAKAVSTPAEARPYFEMMAQVRQQQTQALMEQMRLQMVEERLKSRPSGQKVSSPVAVFSTLLVLASLISVGVMVWSLTRTGTAVPTVSSNPLYALVAAVLNVLLYLCFPAFVTWLVLSGRARSSAEQKKTLLSGASSRP